MISSSFTLALQKQLLKHIETTGKARQRIRQPQRRRATTQQSMAAAAAATASDISYRAVFDRTQVSVGVAVHNPKTMGAVVKALHKTNQVVNRKGVNSVVDVSYDKVVTGIFRLRSSSNQDKAADDEQSLRKSLADKNARVIVLRVPLSPEQQQRDKYQCNSFVGDILPRDVTDALISTLSADEQKSIQDARQRNGDSEEQQNAAMDAILFKHFTPCVCAVRTTYLNYSATEILAALLPAGVVVPSGFEQVGHICHLNLLKEHEPHKRLIAQVILDCSAGNIRTVVNKTEALSSVFRELPFELLAGEASYTATVKQHGVEFRVPYDKVYWNSKLSHEHTRLVTEAMQPGDELLDVMAGVGPFAVPAALQQHVRVLANDLNPAAAEAMKVNAALNKVPDGTFDVFNMDGRAFVLEMRDKRLKQGELEEPSNKTSKNTKWKDLIFREKRSLRHFVMNLPATAVQFLDAFVGEGWPAPASSLASRRVSFDHTFVVHVYCFSACSDNAEATRDAVAQVAKVLGKPVGESIVGNNGASVPAASVLVHRVHIVRDVAPKKLMVCVSFSPSIVAPPEQHAALRQELSVFRSDTADETEVSAPARRSRND